jgi:hypothetical protein
MKSIPVGNQDLILESWEAWEHTGKEPVLVLRRKFSGTGVELHLNEVRHLVDALAAAAAELAAATVIPPEFTD